MTAANEQHTWDEWHDSSYSCSFYLFIFPIRSLIAYFDILQFKKQCVLSDFNVIICYTIKMSFLKKITTT